MTSWCVRKSGWFCARYMQRWPAAYGSMFKVNCCIFQTFALIAAKQNEHLSLHICYIHYYLSEHWLWPELHFSACGRLGQIITQFDMKREMHYSHRQHLFSHITKVDGYIGNFWSKPTPFSSHSWQSDTFCAVKKFPTFYGIQRLTTLFTRGCHLSLSWVR